MTRISSLFLASTLALLPISAFAQTETPVAPAKTTGPASMTTTAPNSDKSVAGTASMDKATGTMSQTTKPDAKTTVHGAKTEVHGANSVTAPHAKVIAPAKS